MTGKSAWLVVLMMLAAAASPAAAFAIPGGAARMPMHSGSGQSPGMAAGCNCQESRQAPAAMPGEPLPRTASGPEPSPCTGSAAPVSPGISCISGRVSGIRRIYPKNVLDHPDRAAIYAAIVANPGIDLGGIASGLGMNRETLRYHLDQLESATRVVVMRDHRIVRYYENHGRYSPLERKVLQHHWNPTAVRILALISAIPGITQAEIAIHLGVTAPTVRWYMQRLRTDDIIIDKHEGKYTRYILNPEVIPFIRRTETVAAVGISAG